MPIPVALLTEPDHLSAEWFEAVLAPAGTTEVRAVSHSPVGTGLMARSHRFELDATGGPSSVVCKFPSAEAATRELGARAYQLEVGFYRDVADRCGARVPLCHHADISSTGGDFILVLEDIAHGAQGDQLTGCSVDEARRAITNLAHLHAATWNDAALDGYPWVPESDPASLGLYMGLAHPPFVERFQDLVEPSTLEVFGAFAASAVDWNDAQPSTRAAVHGDYRLDNLLFAAESDEVVAVDWQTISLGNPGRDLAYFLGNSLTTDRRRSHEDELVQHYVGELAAAGVDGYSVEQCWADVRHGAFQGPLVTMLGAFTAGRSERSEAMFAAMADRSAAQIVDHDALAVLR